MIVGEWLGAPGPGGALPAVGGRPVLQDHVLSPLSDPVDAEEAPSLEHRVVVGAHADRGAEVDRASGERETQRTLPERRRDERGNAKVEKDRVLPPLVRRVGEPESASDAGEERNRKRDV